MPRLPEENKEEIKDRTRRQLLKAAAEQFAREGYVGANINRISEAAGFAKGTIYNYFFSKRALMLSLIEDIATDHIAFVRQQIMQEESPSERLESFFSAGFAFVEREPARAGVIINAVYGPDEEFKNYVYQVYAPLFALVIQDILEAGMAAGQFRPVDADMTAALIMTVYLGSCSQVEPDGTIWLDSAEVAAFVSDGIRRRAPSVD
jgi:AcrR family transcriptional regulator